MNTRVKKSLVPNPPSPLVLLHVASVMLPWAIGLLGAKIHRYGMALSEFKVSFGFFDFVGSCVESG